jgi:hypothetical protein
VVVRTGAGLGLPIKRTARALAAYRLRAVHRQFGRRFLFDHALPGTGRADRRDYSLSPMVAAGTFYVHIPKAAGMSVLRALFGNAGMGHMSVREYRRVLRPGFVRRAKALTTVRNPWDRLHSAYHFLQRGGWPGTRDDAFHQLIATCPSFEHFVLDWLDRDDVQQVDHFRPSWDFLADDDGTLFPFAFVARFEALAADFAVLAGIVGGAATLPRLNATGGERADYRCAFTPHMVDRVQRYEAELIAATGYTFE